MTKSSSVLSRLVNACAKRGVDQQRVFQSFITGGVTCLAGTGTLLLLNQGTLTLQQDVLVVIALFVAGSGLIIASASYILLLLLRRSQPPNPLPEDKNDD